MRECLQELIVCSLLLAAITVAFVCGGEKRVRRMLQDLAGE